MDIIVLKHLSLLRIGSIISQKTFAYRKNDRIFAKIIITIYIQSRMDDRNIKKAVAKELALQHKFDRFGDVKKWNGCDVFRTSNKSYEGKCIGYPIFIIVDRENNARFASHDDVLDIMKLYR